MVTVIPDYTLLIQMVIFIALIFVLNLLLYKPILSIIDRRKKQLEESENEIKLFNESVEKSVLSMRKNSNWPKQMQPN